MKKEKTVNANNRELQNFREYKNYSRYEMATKLEFSKSMYEKIELGFRNPSYNFLLKLKESFPDFDINLLFN